MEFEIGKGLEPTSLRTGNKKYAAMREALADAGADEWLHVDVAEEWADRFSNSVSSGSNTAAMKLFKVAGFKTQTAVRLNKHDRTIPVGTARVFFRKVRA